MTNDPSIQSEPNRSPHLLVAEDENFEVVDLEMVTEQILADPNLTQHVTRRNEDGQDTLAGYFRCQLQPAQQRYALHVHLYPAMSEIPEVEAIVMDSDNASVRVTDRQRFGIRLEISLNRPTEEKANVMVEVIALCGG